MRQPPENLIESMTYLRSTINMSILNAIRDITSIQWL
jgi:hypothetical protein